MNRDSWLDRWLDLVIARSSDRAVLELGCGGGRDSEILAAAGFHVVGIDISPGAIARARIRAPSCEFHCRDILDPFPTTVRSVNVVVASLSLHYFSWQDTLDIAERIHAILIPRGVLLCRLNSTNDLHYGASGHPAIAENYYLVDGRPKRFFDRAAADALFSHGWNVLNLEEMVVNRYVRPKVLWEVVLERD